MPHAAVSANQRLRAKQLRQRMTKAETLLWRYLKAGHLQRLAFRRQTLIGKYIVDFVCHAVRLVVEIGGETHDFVQRQRLDAQRDAWLASRGYTVLRFRNDDVLQNLEVVRLAIDNELRARVAAIPPSLPLPRKEGGKKSM